MTKEEVFKKLKFFGNKLDINDLERLEWLYNARAGYEKHANKKIEIINEGQEIIKFLKNLKENGEL